MGKTAEQKLSSAQAVIRESKKKIKELSQKIYSMQHRIDRNNGDIIKMKAEIKNKDDKISSANMYMPYLAMMAFKSNDFSIPVDDVLQFWDKYKPDYDYNQDTRMLHFTITEKKEKQ